VSYQPKLFAPPPAPASGDKPPYVFTDQILVAVDVALATGRPLLVTGQPGAGKSTLSRAIAAGLDWRYLSVTVTSRTRLENLQADIDTLQRLSDAQLAREGRKLPPDWTYLRPGVLWWAFDRSNAERRGATAADLAQLEKVGVLAPAPLTDPSEGNRASDNVVVLLDEIDKADPDLPNDLLEPLDRRRFSFTLPNRPPVKAAENVKILLVLTSNGERDLPPAFLRRCIVLDLPELRSRNKVGNASVTLESIAEAHFPHENEKNFVRMFGEVAQEIEALRDEALAEGRRPPSTAEYLDALRALKAIPKLKTRETVWNEVKEILLRKKLRAQESG
jgi:MoxR-like ATPase